MPRSWSACLRSLAAAGVFALGSTAPFPGTAAAAGDDDAESTPLFDGTDLSGWTIVNGDASTWIARDGMIVCSGIPAGVLRSDRIYENFVLELEYQHVAKGGNAGLFIWSDALPARGQPFTRSIEVQVMDGVETENYTSDGDVFAIHGATMTPDRPHPAGWMRCLPREKRARPAPEWNHYRVIARDGTLKLEVNGAEVSGGSSIAPSRGHICLESEGSEVHFRNLRVRELPASSGAPTGPAEERDAQLRADAAFRSLYDGVDLRGWKSDETLAAHWRATDWILDYDGKASDLWSEESFRDFELIVDWRLVGPPREKSVPVVLADGRNAVDSAGAPLMETIQDWGDSGIYLRGNAKSQVNIWSWSIGSGEIWGYRVASDVSDEVRRAVTPRVRADAPPGEWNRFHITMKGDRVSVVLNGRQVIENARLPGVPASGPIALQHHGDPIQFANIYVKRLD